MPPTHPLRLTFMRSGPSVLATGQPIFVAVKTEQDKTIPIDAVLENEFWSLVQAASLSPDASGATESGLDTIGWFRKRYNPPQSINRWDG